VTPRRAIVLCLVGLLPSAGITACAVTDTTQYYTLGQVGASVQTAMTPSGVQMDPAGMDAVAIGVGPVHLPGYLDRLQIVTRTSGDQVDLSPFYRWAEPLDEGIARVLAEEIGARVPTNRIVTFPWRGSIARVLQYQVIVAVLRFDARQGGDVVLDARWRILGKDGAELAFRRSTLSEVPAGPRHGPIVAAMTRALLALGQEIAAEIRTMPR
jgi:uncharacterized lipoprotein YmbA